MAETDIHRDDMVDLIETLKTRYVDDPNVYVSGNLLLYYERGNRRKHVSPDVLVSKEVDKHLRDYYLLWEEGKGPDLVIELTSKSTKVEDIKQKFRLYQDILRVQEYILFDPRDEYLKPSMQGFRLHKGRYVPIRLVKGRLPSRVLGLHFERVGQELRLYDPATGTRLLTPREFANQAEAARRQADIARQQAEAENEKLRKELETLRRRLPKQP